jgi:hypothetical protein
MNDRARNSPVVADFVERFDALLSDASNPKPWP